VDRSGSVAVGHVSGSARHPSKRDGVRPMVAVMVVLPVRRLRVVLTVVLCAGAAAGPAHAFRLGEPLAPIPGNPAEHLAALPPDDERYDDATHCDAKRRPGATRMVRWLQSHAAGAFWGSYRCEKWGPRKASLHAEGRAIDWHLDAGTAAGRRDARTLIELLLAPDTAGTPHALARRMGVQELIWDCSYWRAGSDEFGRLSVCYSRKGVLKRRVDKTQAHRDHVHIGLSKAGGRALTSFWTGAG
jgi:hypothetical protein